MPASQEVNKLVNTYVTGAIRIIGITDLNKEVAHVLAEMSEAVEKLSKLAGYVDPW